jgi:hypothetical protein
MQTMQGVGIKEGVKEPGTTYIADNGNLVPGKLKRLQSLVKFMDHFFMGTAWAKKRRPASM